MTVIPSSANLFSYIMTHSPYFFRLTLFSILLGLVAGVGMDAVMHNGQLINADTLGVRALPLNSLALPSLQPSLSPQLTCSNGKDDGQLEGIYAANKTLTGWRCTLDPENVCTAGSNGIFTTCTFSQQEHPWPTTVSATIREHPPTPRPPL